MQVAGVAAFWRVHGLWDRQYVRAPQTCTFGVERPESYATWRSGAPVFAVIVLPHHHLDQHVQNASRRHKLQPCHTHHAFVTRCSAVTHHAFTLNPISSCHGGILPRPDSMRTPWPSSRKRQIATCLDSRNITHQRPSTIHNTGPIKQALSDI